VRLDITTDNHNTFSIPKNSPFNSLFSGNEFEKILSPVSRTLVFVFVLTLLGGGKLLTRERDITFHKDVRIPV
jgi:hypothetical protein